LDYVYSPYWAEDAPECERCQQRGDVCRECRALHFPPPLRSNWPTRLMGFKRPPNEPKPSTEAQKVIRKNERKRMRFYCPRAKVA